MRTRAELDIGDATCRRAAPWRRAGADWIVNAAAYTAVDLAEDQRAQAMAVNDTAVGVLARRGGACGLPAAAFVDGFRV